MVKGAGSGAVLLLLLASISPAASTAETPVLDRVLKNRELRVATSGTQPPFNAVSKDGQLIGLEVDLARYLADAMGVDLSLTSMPFPDLLPALREGKVDMVLSGISITPERSREFAFVGPYVLSGKSVLTDSKTLLGMKSARDLDRPELTLVALLGSTSESYLARVAPRAKLVTTRDYETAIGMVTSGTASALVADMPVCILAVMRHPDKDLGTLSSPLTVEPVGIVLSPSDARFQNLVENYLQAIERTGLLEELRKRWLEQSQWISALP
jgi:polar amino acid transport system substrate-binding protein